MNIAALLLVSLTLSNVPAQPVKKQAKQQSCHVEVLQQGSGTVKVCK